MRNRSKPKSCWLRKPTREKKKKKKSQSGNIGNENEKMEMRGFLTPPPASFAKEAPNLALETISKMTHPNLKSCAVEVGSSQSIPQPTKQKNTKKTPPQHNKSGLPWIRDPRGSVMAQLGELRQAMR